MYLHAGLLHHKGGDPVVISVTLAKKVGFLAPLAGWPSAVSVSDRKVS